mmetsp:Transcript_25318/g.47561  ORF Transcript_25318/g.47561 Transcript_25318/m.47561 type:complete len:246 (-) Transcript_25318:2404-3141(-)
MLPQDVVTLAAHLFELREANPRLLVLHDQVGESERRFPVAHNVSHLRREDERSPLSLVPELALEIAEEVPKVDVEQVALFGYHDVVRVPVSDAQHVSGNAVASTCVDEILDGIKVLRTLVVILQELIDGSISPRPHVLATVLHLNSGSGVAILDDFDHAQVVTGGAAHVRIQSQVQTVLSPESVHDSQQLKRHQILPQVVPGLEDRNVVLAVLVGVVEPQHEGHLLARHHLRFLALEPSAFDSGA